jgi:T3SS negative regulator,GrlR
MDDGIYSVLLTSNHQPAGEGILVLSGRTIHGGGPGYLWKGYYNQESDTIRCELWAYRKDHATIFGQRDRYTLRLERDSRQTQLIFLGHADENPPVPVSVEFVWESPLVEQSDSYLRE